MRLHESMLCGPFSKFLPYLYLGSFFIMPKRAGRRLTIPFGLREGRLRFVADVPLGLACGCTCPECGEPLVALNGDFEGRRRVRYFRHASTSSCPGGVETALHRMAKEVLGKAASLLLPRWASGDVVIEPEIFSVIDARLEVPLLDGATRPDVLLHGVASNVELEALCVEVRVHHAVDDAKRALLTLHGMDVVEIDLSDLDDETLSDPMAFRRAVVENAENRTWINLACGRFVAQLADRSVIEVEDTTVTERVITTKAGRPFIIREQWAFLVKPGSREPVRIQIPDETVGEIAEPYPRGLHSISSRSVTVDQWGRLSLRYKMYLDQIQINPPETGNPQTGLFDAGDHAGPGFNVRQRAWKATSGF